MALNPRYERVVVASRAERTATATFGQKYQNTRHRGIYLLLRVHAISDSPSITMKIQGKWNLDDSWADILVDAAVTSATTSPLTVYPGSTVTANVSANAYLPPHWQVVATHGDSDEADYDIIGFLLP